MAGDTANQGNLSVSAAPILANKDPNSSSVFEPTALLREARRQKGLAPAKVPAVCILDPDGDIVRRLNNSGQTSRFEAWPCYHTDLFTFALASETVGIIGRVVGAPFAVLIAEELFACGCRLLVSLTSAGQILRVASPPYFVIIDRALRDEGTSYHYAAPATFAQADPRIVATAVQALKAAGIEIPNPQRDIRIRSGSFPQMDLCTGNQKDSDLCRTSS